MNLLDLPVRRPVAVSMVFVGMVILGLVGWQRIPVELMPAIQGDSLYVSFWRAGSEPEVVEREMLLPLQARVSALPHVAETWGQVRGMGGNFRVRFESGTDIKVREAELRRIAAAIAREQPRGQASLRVSSTEDRTSALGSFVMMVHVLGGTDGARQVDLEALYDRTDQLLAPRFAAVPGVSEAFATGGARRQVTVTVDPRRVVAAGVTPMEVIGAVSRNMEQTRHVGTLESPDGRQQVLMEGQPPGLHGLRDLRMRPDRPAKLGHVADIAFGVSPDQSYLRVNGEPAVGVVIYQEQGANLIRLGRALRERVEELRREIAPLGLDLVIGSDAAEAVEKQIGHLAKLALSGYLIALAVLFLFLREWRAVAVVGVAVPVSLLAALALLYLFDQTLNVISLIGLSLSIGLLIDNSIVVYEAVLRGLERGAAPADAARRGVRRTALAIAAASATTAIVFLPMTLVDLDTTAASLLGIVAAALLLPLAASLLVAVGLVPVLAYRLAAPAAAHRVRRSRQRRERSGGLRPPDPARILFAGVLKNALRRPSGWLAGTLFAVLLTLVTAVPLALSGSGRADAERADEVRMLGRYARGAASADALANAVGRVEGAVLRLEGVDTVVSEVSEDGASITVRFVDEEERPERLTVSRVREVAKDVAEEINGFELLRPGEERIGGKGRGGGGEGMQAAFGGGPREVVLSGPETAPLNRLARDIVARLEAVPAVANAWQATPPGMEELWVAPNRRAFEAFGLTLDEVLPVLQVVGREGFRAAGGFVLASGREIPVVVERVGAREPFAGRDLRRLRVQTESGVAPIAALASIRQMPPSPMITHHNGRREASVYFRLGRDVPDSGPGLAAVEKEVAAVAQTAPRQPGYTVEVREQDETDSMARKLAVPALLLLALVLAMAFESLTLPVLVLLALPLAVLGSAWLFVFTGTPASMMAAAGVIMLFGLAVNPAILLVDRIAQRVRGGWSPGAAALAAVRERTRPVLMTSATTIAALWPLAITTGRENELWPPFAIVVIGGLITSTVLTLLVVPVAYILLQRLDRLFGRVGPWLVVGWFGATLAVMLSLTLTDVITSLLWQVVTSLLVGGGLLAVTVLAFRRVEVATPDTGAGPPAVDVRNLKKTYGLPGPLRTALRAGGDFQARVLAQGGVVEGVGFELRDALRRFGPQLILTVAPFGAAHFVQGSAWKLLLWMLGGLFFGRLLLDVRRARGRADAAGVVTPGGVEGVARTLVPWLLLAAFAYWMWLAPFLAGDPPRTVVALPVLAAVLLGVGQLVRRSAVLQQRGQLAARARSGPFRYPRTLLRRWALRLGGFDLPVRPVRAVSEVSFRVEKGMVGVLGPNGAGKTTLLRQLAGILDPTRGAIFLGGAPLGKVRNVLARWVGYLPQDAGLPGGLSAREYLSYFGALYDLPVAARRERVERLLREVGLEGKADDKIKALSGGMRQRVAVARTLLRLPPVIIVDEPTVGLDPRERIRFRNLLSRLAEERIVLFSTHVVEDVAVACERVLVLAAGRLVFDGEPAALAQAAHGRVWEVRSPAAERFDVPSDAILAEETPAGGVTVRRVLRETSPAVDAKAVEARLEDGYLWLISRADLDAATAPGAA